jgi:hypothetical protein
LSDWDIDVKESIAYNKGKSTVQYTAPPKKKQVDVKPDPEEYDDEYYEEDEDELVEIDYDGEEVKAQAPAVDIPAPELPKTESAVSAKTPT